MSRLHIPACWVILAVIAVGSTAGCRPAAPQAAYDDSQEQVRLMAESDPAVLGLQRVYDETYEPGPRPELSSVGVAVRVLLDAMEMAGDARWIEQRTDVPTYAVQGGWVQYAVLEFQQGRNVQRIGGYWFIPRDLGARSFVISKAEADRLFTEYHHGGGATLRRQIDRAKEDARRKIEASAP